MKANQGWYHLLFILDIASKHLLPNCPVKSSSYNIFLGVIIGGKLDFNDHVTNMCNKASTKTQSLARIFPYMLITQRDCFLMNV